MLSPHLPATIIRRGEDQIVDTSMDEGMKSDFHSDSLQRVSGSPPKFYILRAILPALQG